MLDDAVDDAFQAVGTTMNSFFLGTFHGAACALFRIDFVFLRLPKREASFARFAVRVSEKNANN